MNSDISPAASLSVLVARMGAFANFGPSFPKEQTESGGVLALGVSSAAAPLISAPASRQSVDFQSSIAAPTQPANPAIAPPKKGGRETMLSGTGSSMSGAAEILAYIAALKLQMAGAQGNGPSGAKTDILAMMGKGASA